MQKNKYNIVVANPANNITVFVLDYIERENYNTGEGKAKVPQVTTEKREAIIDALRYFQMIE